MATVANSPLRMPVANSLPSYEPGVVIETMARSRAATGVEMEALTAASIAALTVYDMCKAASKDIIIGPIRTGGSSGGVTNLGGVEGTGLLYGGPPATWFSRW